jgi:hypothetical protein
MINSRLALSNAERFDLKFVTGSFSLKTAGLLYNLSPYYGFPSGGAFNPGNTTSGVVPVASSTDTLFPALPQVGANQELRIGGVSFDGTDLGQPILWDRLWHAGPFSGTSSTTYTFSSQPSFLDRIGSSSGSDIFLIMEVVSDFSNAPSISANLTDLNGTYIQAVSPSLSATPKSNSLAPFTAAQGQHGVKAVQSLSVNSSSTSGSFNLVVARMLFEVPGGGVYRPLESQMVPWTKRGLIWIPSNAALWLTWRAATTNAVTATLGMEIFKG